MTAPAEQPNNEQTRAEAERIVRELGATDAQIADTHSLAALGSDLVLAQGRPWSLRTLAREIGISVEEAARIYRSLGVAVSDPDEPRFSDRDLAVIGMLHAAATTLAGSGSDILRVVGTGLARVADAAVSAYVQEFESDLDADDECSPEHVRRNVATARLALELGEGLAPLFVHHLHGAVERQRTAQQSVSSRQHMRLAVGFVDLVGYTAWSQSHDPAEVIDAITRFEVRAFDLAVEHGSRVVKHIGDEVMFVSLDPVAAGRLALALVAELGTGAAPRGGLCAGEVLTRHGDHYGPVVNLASRLVDAAVPGEVLVDEDYITAAGDGSGLTFEPAGRRVLKGFDEPVRAWSLG